jgi:predicted branched-subunit amino acid permease
MRLAFGTPGLVLGFSFVGFGSLAHDIGWPLWVTLVSVPLIWALPAQVILIGGLASGSVIGALAAVSFSSIRLLPMVTSFLPVMRGPGQSRLHAFYAGHFVAQTLWVEGFRHLPAMPREHRGRFVIIFAHTLVIISCTGTLIGYLATGVLPAAVAVGLVFLSPCYFLYSLEGNARRLEERLAIIAGLVVGPPLVVLAPGFDLLLAGLIGGTAAFAAAKLIERRRRAP